MEAEERDKPYTFRGNIIKIKVNDQYEHSSIRNHLKVFTACI